LGKIEHSVVLVRTGESNEVVDNLGYTKGCQGALVFAREELPNFVGGGLALE
jgi:hypothetical protein